MSAMKVYSMTREELENIADTAKTAVIEALVAEGILPFDKADEWCQTHTVLIRKKSIFKTISNLFESEIDDDSMLRFRVVRALTKEKSNASSN